MMDSNLEQCKSNVEKKNSDSNRTLSNSEDRNVANTKWNSNSPPRQSNFFTACPPFEMPQSEHRMAVSNYLDCAERLANFYGLLDNPLFGDVREQCLRHVATVRMFAQCCSCQFLSELLHKAKQQAGGIEPTKSNLAADSNDSNSNLSTEPVPVPAAVKSVLWLNRSLHFFAHVLRMILDDIRTGSETSLVEMLRSAYDVHWAPHLSWFENWCFELALSTIPDRKWFMEQTFCGELPVEMGPKLEQYAVALDEVNRTVQRMLRVEGFES